MECWPASDLSQIRTSRPEPDQTIDCHEIFPHGQCDPFSNLFLNQSELFRINPKPVLIRINQRPIQNQSELLIRMNPKFTGFIRIVISDLFGLFLNWLRVDPDWKFALDSFGITRFSSESDAEMARNSADWFGVNFNSELSPGWTYMMFKIFFKIVTDVTQ